MAVVVDAKDADKFIAESAKENLEANNLWQIRNQRTSFVLLLNWRGNDIS